MNLTDTFWVGRLGKEAVAAVAISFPIIFLIKYANSEDNNKSEDNFKVIGADDLLVEVDTDNFQKIMKIKYS